VDVVELACWEVVAVDELVVAVVGGVGLDVVVCELVAAACWAPLEVEEPPEPPQALSASADRRANPIRDIRISDIFAPRAVRSFPGSVRARPSGPPIRRP
jgi:hypothetical protein